MLYYFVNRNNRIPLQTVSITYTDRVFMCINTSTLFFSIGRSQKQSKSGFVVVWDIVVQMAQRDR